jgi:hypothetical protein
LRPAEFARDVGGRFQCRQVGAGGRVDQKAFASPVAND